jgi:hypothetical protein
MAAEEERKILETKKDENLALKAKFPSPRA